MRLVRLPVLGITLALAIAAPAAAISGGGMAATLSKPQVQLDSTKKDSARTCQAGRNHEKTKWTIVGSSRKIAVVACEQPPRSQFAIPSLKQLNTNSSAVIG